MAYSQKTWVNRESEYPNRYTMVSQNGNTANVAITPNEGVVTTEGDVFDADTMNDFESRISSGFTESAQALDNEDTAIKALIEAEKDRALGIENQLQLDLTDNENAVSAEETRAKAAEEEISGSVSTLEGTVSGLSSDVGDLTTRVGNAESDVSTLASSITGLETSIGIETNRAEGVESDLQTNLSNLSNTVNQVSADILAETARAQAAESAINTRLTTVYKASGSINFIDLPEPIAARVGNVYDIKDAFTTTLDFVEGAGKSYPAGTNVAIVQIEVGTSVEYMYDAMSGIFDNGFELVQDNVALSTSQATTVTFSDARILATSTVDCYTTVDGLEYSSMITSTGSCVVTFAEQETAITIGVKIYVR